MPNGNDIFQREVLRLLDEQVSSLDAGLDPYSREIARLMGDRALARPEEGPGFLTRAIDALTPTSREEFRLIGAGLLSPSLEAGQALFEIPGLFTSRNLPTDRAADFLDRVNQNLLTRTERAAIQAGATPELVADSHLLGEIVGFVAPVVASLKAARLVTGIQGPITGVARNFVLDSSAGAIFGAALLPGEELQDRAIHALRESAIFGVGGLMLNGLVFAAHGMRFSRARRLQGEEELEDMLRRIANGEQVVINGEAVPLSRLMSEEGFLASSVEAYDLLGRFEVEGALQQAVRDFAEAGASRGFIRSVGDDFQQVSRVVDRMREQGPAFRYDIVRGETGFDVHFGLSGLNNQQKAQLTREGRYVGQVLEKNGTTYQYVRRGKGDRLVVRTAEGKTTTIRPEGVSDLPYAVEDVAVPTTGQALYADFREFYFDRVRQAAAASGGMTETEIVRALRDGTLDLTEQNLRMFEVGGAITHPTEVGINPATGSRFVVQQVPVEGTVQPGSFAFQILDNSGNPQGFLTGEVRELGRGRLGFDVSDMESASGEAWTLGVGGLRDVSRQISTFLREQGLPVEVIGAQRTTGASLGTTRNILWEVDRLIRESPSPQGFSESFLRQGKVAGDILEPDPIRNTEDAFQAWLRERGLNPSTEDIEAFRANFNQRLRQDIWAMVPEEDLATFQRIREETLALIDERGLPFAALAHNKGFHVERLAEGRVSLRDINTGARLEFGDEAFAREALENIVRAEKDPMSGFVTPGDHGMPALTGGFMPHENVWTFDDNIAAAEFLGDLPFAGITNLRDYLRRIEDMSGLQLFSRGFSEMDEAMVGMLRDLGPILNRVEDAWKGLNLDQRVQVAEFWTAIEGSELAGTALVRAARDAGLSNRQIRAFTQSRALFDLAAQMRGLPRSRYIPLYYSRVRPAIERGEIPNYRRLLADDPVALREFEDPANFTRTGDMSNIEMDPQLVMYKHFRSLFYGQRIWPIEQRIRQLIDTRIRDLPLEQQRAVMARAIAGTTKDSRVLPDPVRSVLTEYANNIRGVTNPGFQTARRFTNRLFKMLGMETDERVFDEMINTYLSMQYGAAIGLRFALTNRNAVQNLWMMYSRVGGKYGTEALRRAMTQEGFDKWVTAGAIRPVEATVPMGDAIFESWLGNTPVRGSGPVSMAFAAAIRKGLRLGQITRQTAQKFLVPYGTSDQINRAWAAEWQYLHTAEHLGRFDIGKISWDKFLEDGLPFFSEAVKREFRSQFDRFGRERALQWIGKQAADEAHFIYGSASTPPWMQRPFGRLLGVFGQWPLWAFEMYKRRMAHGTPAQVAGFWARTLALAGAFGNMTAQTGINLWNWVAPLSFEYAGGPFTDVLVQARVLAEGTVDQKVTALEQMGRSVGSLALPGKIFFLEISASLDQNDPGQAALMLTLGRPVDQGNFAFDIVYNPGTEWPGDQDDRSSIERVLNLEGLPLIGPGGSEGGIP